MNMIKGGGDLARPRNEKPRVRWSSNVDEALFNSIRLLASKKDKKLSEIIDESLEDILDKYEKKGIEKMAENETKVIVFACNKGGVGKTTSSTCTAHLLGKMGQKVLFIDTDSQANATSAFGFDVDEESKNTLSSYITDSVKRMNDMVNNGEEPETAAITDYIKETRFKNVSLISADKSLRDDIVTVLTNIAPVYGNLFDYMIADIRELDYDYVIIDTAPRLDAIVTNIFKASDYVVIPTDADLDGIYGCIDTLRTVKAQGGLKRFGQKSAELAGILFTRIDMRKAVAKSNVNGLRTQFGDNVNIFNVLIPEAASVSKAKQLIIRGETEPVRRIATEAFPADKVTKKYEEFVKELIAIVTAAQ